MERRKFIKLITGLSLVSLGTYTIIPDFDKVVKKMIEEEVINLQFTDRVIDQFLKDASLEKFWTKFNGFKQEFIKIHFLLENQILPLPYFNKYQQYKNKIIGQFLLSTDFFKHGMNTSRKIDYISFYNPYKMPCANPFSNLYYKT